jgi:hypothetical protein
MVADRGRERWGCLVGAGGVAELPGEAFCGVAGRKLWGMIKLGKWVDCEEVAGVLASCSESAKGNTFS